MIKMMNGKTTVEDNRIATLPFKDDIQMIIEPSKNQSNQWQFTNILPGSDRQVIVGDGYYLVDSTIIVFQGLSGQYITINDGVNDTSVLLGPSGELLTYRYSGYINTITHTDSKGNYDLYMRCDQSVGDILNNYVVDSPVKVTVTIDQDAPFHIQNLATLSTTKNKSGYIIDKANGTHHTKMIDGRSLKQIDFEKSYNLDDFYTVDSNGNSLLGNVRYKLIPSYIGTTVDAGTMIALVIPVSSVVARGIVINGTAVTETNIATLESIPDNGVDSIQFIPFISGGTLTSFTLDGVTIYPYNGEFKDIKGNAYGMLVDAFGSGIGFSGGGYGIMLPYCYDILHIFSNEIDQFDSNDKLHWGENDGYFEPISIADLNIYANSSNLFFGDSTIENYGEPTKYLSTMLLYNSQKNSLDKLSINKYVDRSNHYIEI